MAYRRIPMNNISERDRLIREYMPLARKMARSKQKSLPHINVDEFISAAYTGLVDAASRFEESRGNFAPFARTRIYGEMQDYLRSLGFGSKGSVSRGCTKFDSLDATTASGEPILSFLQARPDRDFRTVFEETVEPLDDTGRHIFKLRFCEERSLDEIGRELGVSESRVSQRISQYKKQLAAAAA
jgi:RNA polymerase sigma factor (sigma-70 family)